MDILLSDSDQVSKKTSTNEEETPRKLTNPKQNNFIEMIQLKQKQHQKNKKSGNLKLIQAQLLPEM